MPIAKMDPYVDNWNLMAFDYQGGGFSNFTGHLSNVYPSLKNPKSTTGWDSKDEKFVPFNTKQAIDHYKANVASPSKIQLGLPLYGVSFANVVELNGSSRGLGQKFNGTGEGSFESGILNYKDLPQNGSRVYNSDDVIASWSWDPIKKQLVSFDTPKVSTWKTEYLKQEGLGGAWFWESSGDREITSDKSSVATVRAPGASKFFLAANREHRLSKHSAAQGISKSPRTIYTIPGQSTIISVVQRMRLPPICRFLEADLCRYHGWFDF